eukprot:CAMPEP_0181238596 /NCGR_PEP_ID=MMETSP1096-20121128/39443_1 /TAXON_ID=156174 ORGANISM="Chrysochromulina ericina, Strain CCMP281" /NCGR_SAMPLE_ID=MMETSP1096 /ASSEMBLY_ACC=CAM_ASM_000453 /LENGTH=125 /DNA_ID=CAMNT_0023334153 /DNA_START=628 /DNA_END=1003 /DNA_ORIENTATION=+
MSAAALDPEQAAGGLAVRFEAPRAPHEAAPSWLAAHAPPSAQPVDSPFAPRPPHARQGAPPCSVNGGVASPVLPVCRTPVPLRRTRICPPPILGRRIRPVIPQTPLRIAADVDCSTASRAPPGPI